MLSKIKIYNFLINNLNKEFICLIFNLFFFFRNNQTKIIFKDNKCYITENNKFWRIFSLNRILFYTAGLRERARKLHAEYLIDEIHFNDNDVVIDCGASNGDFFLNFKKKIKYYGYEASPYYFDILKENLPDQNVENIALNKFKGTSDFFIYDINADSSLINNNYNSKKITVYCDMLDNIINKIRQNIKLIKIEAEGAEPEVLLGLKANIINVEYITIDCGPERGFEKKSTFSMCEKYLINNNFLLVKKELHERKTALFKNKLK